jgi:hypothetical protein
MSLAADTPFPREEVRALQRALNRAYGETGSPGATSLARSCATLLTTAGTAGRTPLRDAGDALQLAVESIGLFPEGPVAEAAGAVKGALGADGAVRGEPGRSVTPFTADRSKR